MENQNQNSAQGQTSINIQVPSADNIASKRPLIPFSFALAIIFFFFTFCSIKCGGQKISSLTGINLVTGTELKDRDLFTGQETNGKKIPSSIWAIFAFGAAVVGLGVFLIKEKREALIGTFTGTFGVCSLIILQFVIKNSIYKEANGQIEVDFQFPYWGALIALGIAGLISYLRMRQTFSLMAKYSHQPSPVYQQSGENSQHQVQTDSQYIQQSAGFDIAGWFKKNSKIIILTIAAIIGLYVGYYFFLKHDPERDAKRIAASQCNCNDTFQRDLIVINEKFLKSFDEYGFTRNIEASDKLQVLQKSTLAKYQDCISLFTRKLNVANKRYSSKNELLVRFNSKYNNMLANYKPSNLDRLTAINTEIGKKINQLFNQNPHPASQDQLGLRANNNPDSEQFNKESQENIYDLTNFIKAFKDAFASKNNVRLASFVNFPINAQCQNMSKEDFVSKFTCTDYFIQAVIDAQDIKHLDENHFELEGIAMIFGKHGDGYWKLDEVTCEGE